MRRFAPAIPALGTAVLFSVSCVATSPLFERARAQDGFGMAFLAGAETGRLSSGPGSSYGVDYPIDRHLSGLGIISLRDGVGRRTYFLNAGAGTGTWLTDDWAEVPLAIPLVFQLGLKHVLDSEGNAALRVLLGWPGGIEAAWLQDFGRTVTTGLGLGILGASASVATHLPLAGNLDGHLSLSTAFSPWGYAYHPPSTVHCLAASLGVAIEWRARASYTGWTPRYGLPESGP